MNVPQVDGSESLCGTGYVLKGSCNDSQCSAVSGQIHRGNFPFENSLVLRARHFQMRRQIDPKLCGFEHSSLTREFLPMQFLMNDTRCSRHPLNVARTDPPGVSA